ncbi:MAG: hypothetical protein ACTSRK_19285 [Promethearchaeota archaeon]
MKNKIAKFYVVSGILLGCLLLPQLNGVITSRVDQINDYPLAQIGSDEIQSQVEETNNSKLSITFLLFPNYPEEATFIDPILKSLMIFYLFDEIEIKEIISDDSYKSYRNLAILRGDSVLVDPNGSTDEYIIPITQVYSVNTNLTIAPRILVEIPKSVFNALKDSSFVRAIDDVTNATGQADQDAQITRLLWIFGFGGAGISVFVFVRIWAKKKKLSKIGN